MSTKPLDFSDLGATQVAPAKLDFSDLGGKVVSPAPSQPQSKGALDQLEDFGKHLWSQINPVSGLKGMAQATSHPVQTIQNDVNARQQVLDKAHEELSKGNYSDGAALWLYAHVPLLGAQLANAGEEFKQGKFGAGAGDSTGIGLNLAAPKFLKGSPVPGTLAQGSMTEAATAAPKLIPQVGKGAVQGAAERMYESALKPSTTIPAAQRASIIRTGLDAGIPISQEGAQKLSGLIADYNQKVQDLIKGGADSGATVDPKAIAARADQVKARFANQVNPGADMQAIQAAKEEFLGNNPNPIPVDQAQAMKAGTYQQLKGRAYGELKSATVESQKALARGIKEELEQQFPEIKGLNAQQAKFYDLDGVLERALNRIGNHQLIGIGTPLMTTAGGAVGGMLFGHGPEAGALGLGVGAMKMVLDNPAVKSRLAIALSQGAKVPPAIANARVNAFVNALAQSQRAAAVSASGTGK